MIPEIEPESIFLGGIHPKIDFYRTSYEDGALPDDQAELLLAILVDKNPKEVLEIGTFFGHTTRRMAEALPGAIIHTVDLPLSYSPLDKDDFHLINRRRVGREFHGRACAERIVQHFADTGTWDFREAGAPTFFFIDGSHTYEYVKNDSVKCFELASGCGTFLWHDLDDNHPQVGALLNEWRIAGLNIYRIAGMPLGYLDAHCR
jgi:hypothetical protein